MLCPIHGGAHPSMQACVIIEFTVDPAALHQDDLEKYDLPQRDEVQSRAIGRGVHHSIRI